MYMIRQQNRKEAVEVGSMCVGCGDVI